MDDTMTKAYKSMTRLAMRMDKAAGKHVLLAEAARQAAADLREAAEALNAPCRTEPGASPSS